MTDSEAPKLGRPSMGVESVGWSVRPRDRETLALLAVELGTEGNESATVRRVIEQARKAYDERHEDDETEAA